MRLVVTGASGFIGKNLLLKTPPDWEIVALYNRSPDFQTFLSDNRLNHVRPVQCDLADKERVIDRLGSLGESDVCLYLASLVELHQSIIDPLSDLKANVIGLLNFLETCRTRRFIYMSSGAVYEGLSGRVGPESALAPTLPYAISKLTAERYVDFHWQKRRSFPERTIVRFFGAFGPYEPSFKIYTRMLNAFFIEKTNLFQIKGDGRNLIRAMYVEDAANLIINMIRSRESNVIIDAAAPEVFTISQLVETTAEILGVKELRLKFVGEPAEYITFEPDLGPARAMFDAALQWPYEPAIKAFADFFIGQQRQQGERV